MPCTCFIASKIDYWIALYSGPHMTVTLVHTSAWVLTISKQFDHVTPVLMFLYWQSRADFEITLQGLKGLAPSYISSLITPYSPAHPLFYLDAGHLSVPPINKKSLVELFKFPFFGINFHYIVWRQALLRFSNLGWKHIFSLDALASPDVTGWEIISDFFFER